MGLEKCWKEAQWVRNGTLKWFRQVERKEEEKTATKIYRSEVGKEVERKT